MSIFEYSEKHTSPEDALSAMELQEIACEIFSKDRLPTLIYK